MCCRGSVDEAGSVDIDGVDCVWTQLYVSVFSRQLAFELALWLVPFRADRHLYYVDTYMIHLCTIPIHLTIPIRVWSILQTFFTFYYYSIASYTSNESIAIGPNFFQEV
jgi:hypothetical protein